MSDLLVAEDYIKDTIDLAELLSGTHFRSCDEGAVSCVATRRLYDAACGKSVAVSV